MVCMTGCITCTRWLVCSTETRPLESNILHVLHVAKMALLQGYGFIHFTQVQHAYDFMNALNGYRSSGCTAMQCKTVWWR